jgi:hypothetical protein
MNRIIQIVKMLALWEFVRVHRITQTRHAGLVSASIVTNKRMVAVYQWTLKQVQGDGLLEGKI